MNKKKVKTTLCQFARKARASRGMVFSLKTVATVPSLAVQNLQVIFYVIFTQSYKCKNTYKEHFHEHESLCSYTAAYLGFMTYRHCFHTKIETDILLHYLYFL